MWIFQSHNMWIRHLPLLWIWDTHMSVMFSISASIFRTGKALIPRSGSGSTQEILVLLQEHDDGHASADIQRSPEPTVTPSATTHHHRDRHDPDPLFGEERAPLPGLKALISGANFSYQVRWTAPRPRPRLAGISPGVANQGGWEIKGKSDAEEVETGGTA